MSSSVSIDYQELLREHSPDFEDHFDSLIDAQNPFSTEAPSVLDTINNNYNPWAVVPEPTLWEKIVNKTPWAKEDPSVASHLVDYGVLPESMRPTPAPTTVEVTKHHYFIGGGLLILVVGILIRKRKRDKKKKGAQYQNLETLDQVDDYFDRMEHQRAPHPSMRSPIPAKKSIKKPKFSKKSSTSRKNTSFLQESSQNTTSTSTFTDRENLTKLKKVELILVKTLDSLLDILEEIPGNSKHYYGLSKKYVNLKFENMVTWALASEDENYKSRNLNSVPLLPHENPLEDTNISFAEVSVLASNNSNKEHSRFKIDENYDYETSENDTTTYNSCIPSTKNRNYWKNNQNNERKSYLKKSAYSSKKSTNYRQQRMLTKELYRLAHDVSLAKSSDSKNCEKGDFVTIEIDEN